MFTLTPQSNVGGIAWPAIPGPLDAIFMAMQHQLEQTQWWSPADILDHQLLQLSRLLDHARKTVPFYQASLHAAGLRPDVPLTLDSWRRVPILERPVVQAEASGLISRQVPKSHGGVVFDSTSGSTGTPLKIARTHVSSLMFRAVTMRDHLWHDRDLTASLALIRRDSESRSGYPAGRQQSGWGSPVTPSYPSGPSYQLDIRTSPDQQIEWLRRVEPDYLLTFPTNLAALARRLREGGGAMAPLRGVSTVGEVVDPDLREAVRELWGVEIADLYSAVETGYIALQCPRIPHYHVQSESALVEVIDHDGRPCRPGEIGRVVVTPLHNFAMPLLRYAIGDYAVLGEPCPCGRGLPVLARIMGRVRNMVVLPSGERRFAYIGGKGLGRVHALVQVQIVQRSLYDIEVKLVVRRPLTHEEEDMLRGSIRGNLGQHFAVNFTYHDSIPRGAGGKYEDFRCEVPL